MNNARGAAGGAGQNADRVDRDAAFAVGIADEIDDRRWGHHLACRRLAVGQKEDRLGVELQAHLHDQLGRVGARELFELPNDLNAVLSHSATGRVPKPLGRGGPGL